MTGPDINPSHEARIHIGFIEKFDGSQFELLAGEQQIAARQFSDTIEDRLTTYADYTKGSLFTYLCLGLGFEDKSLLTFVITTSSLMKSNGGASGKVRVIENDTFGLAHETHDYELSNDEAVVRRIDIGDHTINIASKKPGTVRVIGIDPLEDSPIYDAVQNFRLEEQFGINNQPVGIAEVDTLCRLLALATPE